MTKEDLEAIRKRDINQGLVQRRNVTACRDRRSLLNHITALEQQHERELEEVLALADQIRDELALVRARIDELKKPQTSPVKPE